MGNLRIHTVRAHGTFEHKVECGNGTVEGESPCLGAHLERKIDLRTLRTQDIRKRSSFKIRGWELGRSLEYALIGERALWTHYPIWDGVFGWFFGGFLVYLVFCFLIHRPRYWMRPVISLKNMVWYITFNIICQHHFNVPNSKLGSEP